MNKQEIQSSQDIGEEIILLLKEINFRLDNIIKNKNEKKLEGSFLDRNRN